MSNYNQKRIEEQGIIIGNAVDKSSLRNPVAQKIVEGFDVGLIEALERVQPSSIHEVGCGEGRLTRLFSSKYDCQIRASDFSSILIDQNNKRSDPNIQYLNKSIYDLDANDSADLVVCCEVLEHLEFPEEGLKILRSLKARKYIFSVPREPMWRLLNMLRFKYLSALGNTPGHLNHWSPKSFYNILDESGFTITTIINPAPWIMVICE